MALFERPEVVILKESSDAKEYLEKLLDLQNEVQKDTPLYKRIEKEIAVVKAGIAGEDRIMFELKNSGMNLVVLHDICLVDPEGNTAQIDFIVLTPYVTVFIECKNLYGDIEINSRGDFIRTFSYNGHRFKEGIYNPVTQNERHMLVYKNCRSANKGKIMRWGFEFYFQRYNKSLVVLANPKSLINDRYAPRELDGKVIRADQLINTLRQMKSDVKFKKKELLDFGNSILEMNQADRTDYLAKFVELKNAVERDLTNQEAEEIIKSRSVDGEIENTAEHNCSESEVTGTEVSANGKIPSGGIENEVTKIDGAETGELKTVAAETESEEYDATACGAAEADEHSNPDSGSNVLQPSSPEGNVLERDIAKNADAVRICPRCGNRLVMRTAKRGSYQGNHFWGCSSYPKCRYIENLPSGQNEG